MVRGRIDNAPWYRVSPLHLWLSLAFFSFLGWLDMSYPPFNPLRTLILGPLAGAGWLGRTMDRGALR